jgi:hypothetical protein
MKKASMKRYPLLIIFVLFLVGCAAQQVPQDSLEFHQVSQLVELEGVYKNEGDNGKRYSMNNYYLSENIWGYKSSFLWGTTGPNLPAGIRHENIEFIEVSSTEKSLTAKAIEKGCVVYEKTYIIGRYFEIKNGQLIISQDVNLLSPGGQGGVLVGPNRRKITLGIDTANQGKSRTQFDQAGLVYLFLPAAVSETLDNRFERISDKPQGYKNCENR